MEEIQNKAVPNGPFWLWQAHQEFKSNQWASDILAKAGVPAPRHLSALMGKSGSTHQFTIVHSGYWLGFCDGSNVAWTDQVFGNLTPRSWGPFGINSLGCRFDTYNTTFFCLDYPVSDEMIEIKFDDGQTFVFEFLQSHEGSCNNDAGFANKLRSLNGQTVGITMRTL